MDADHWNLENLTLEPFLLPEEEDAAKAVVTAKEEALLHQHLRDQRHDALVKRCEQVSDTLQQWAIAPSSTPHQPGSPDDLHSSSRLFGNVHYTEGAPGVTEQDFDVQIIMEVNTQNILYLFNVFYDKLEKDSEHLGLDPASVAISQYHRESSKFAIRFQLSGSNAGSQVELRLVPAKFNVVPVLGPNQTQ